MSKANPNAGHNNILSNLIHSINHTSSNAMTSSSRSSDSVTTASAGNTTNRQQPLLQGTLYKLQKRNGKKHRYFVIFDDAPNKPGTARLEYFDNEKKFRSSMAKSVDNGITDEKRSIILCNCFNINRRIDVPKYKNVIGLYRKDDTFSIIMKDEKEMNEWLKQLLILQRGKELLDGDNPRPTFEHVWEVNVTRRGLGESYGIIGSYRLCVSDMTLSLIRVGPPVTTTGETRVSHVEFSLANMRRCGCTHSVFFMEVGRFTATGAGEIWMETEDQVIATNMNNMILRAAGTKRSNNNEDNLGPIMRIRSQSANEASKPINHRRATLIGPVKSTVSGSQVATRERCDSLTLTRTRTNSDSSSNTSSQPQLQSILQQNGSAAYNVNNNNSMPPPKKIPSRPLSNAFSQRNSPPNTSSPLSPPSAQYLTESDGSSISIDETDFSHHVSTDDHFYNAKEYNSLTSRTTIPEENENWHRWNNNLALPLNQNSRKGSPNAPSASTDYMDMVPYSSPYSSSPGENLNNANVYMPMSPGVDYRGGIYSSGAHSRASSLAEDNDSYVPMHPVSNTGDGQSQMAISTEDYMNMQPAASTNSSQTSTRGGDISSATSSCSITSGTPSTDIRFSEYHLDKVQARFTPSEDDDFDRPPRTYSVGSKLEHAKRKLHIDRITAEHLNSRHRAYSVGSRNIKVTRAELTSHSGSHTPSQNSPIATNRHEINNNHSTKNKKSSSAPLLVNHSGKAAHGSFDHMDDLMEIDYSNRSNDSIGSNMNNSSTSVKSSPMNIPLKSNDYMNMEGRNSKPQTPSSGNMSPYVDMRPVSARRISENTDNVYMDMNAPQNRSNPSSSLSSSPIKIPSTSKTVPLPPSPMNINYMDMSPRSYDGTEKKNRMTSSGSSLSNKVPSDDYLNMSPVNKSTFETGLPMPSSVPDGYMEMSWNSKNKKAVKSDHGGDHPSSSSDEYINMDFSNNNDVAGTTDPSSSVKDRLISMPITIKRLSISNRSKKSLNSTSIDEVPPAFLPLVNPIITSISPIRSTNRTRCDSRDSGIVTPSSGSQATIFPFSPASPKQFDANEDLSRKCLMDGTSGTIKLSEDDIIEEEPRTPTPMAMNSEKHVETLSSDYAVMNLGEPASKRPNLSATPIQVKSSPPSANMNHFLSLPDSGKNDYINCTPKAPVSSSRIVTPMPISPAANNSTQEVGDYAIMNPLKTSMSTVQTTGCSEIPPQTASRKSLFLQLSSQEKLNSNSCFKPIVEDDRTHQMLHRHVSERGLQYSNDSGYEILAKPSLLRPNSVNSEKIKNTTSFLSNRPSSALSSSSLSSSALCETKSQNSSSQTLRNNASTIPSPMSGISRPESVSSDILMASRPPSVTSERELHYASLELPLCSTNPHSKMDVDQKMDFSTSPSPQQTSSSSSSASSQQSQPAFTYAQIDFAKSESLKAQRQQNQSGSKK